MEESSATADNYNERFAILSEADKDKLLSNKNAESTKAATKYAVKTFHDYCMAAANYQTIVAIDLLPDNALDQLLEKFYQSLRNKNGEKYAVQSLRSIRAGIQRYYTEPPRRREINIISGENFNRSKAMFEAVCIDLKKSGLGDVTHKPVINDEDMAKISAYFKTWKTDPVVLIRKVWFDLMMFCCRRGREGLRELSKTSYVVDSDGLGQKNIKIWIRIDKKSLH